mgnify:FL=1
MTLVEKSKSIACELLIPRRYAHACQVAKILINPSEEELAAAFCHDILEDTFISEEVLKNELGEKVVNIIKELTNNFNNFEEIRDFSYFKNASLEAKKIKLADRIDNINRRLSYNINYNNYKTFLNYSVETEGLLTALKDSEPELENILNKMIKILKDKCSKYIYDI